MTNPHRFIFAALLTVAAGIGSFAATLAARSGAPTAATTSPADASSDAVFDWLGVPAEQRAELRSHDPAFTDDLRRLRAALADRRSELATALDQIATTDVEIRAKSEAIIAASAALERRVTAHLLSIRPNLSPEQQRQLFQLCAEGVRQGQGMQWRRGQGGGQGPGFGGGRGMGMRRGAGRGGPAPAGR
jgi:Spy/CpxP family protein refolding chaperone